MSSTSPTSGLHIAIIPDGNRRWAKAQSLLPWKGHEQSKENFDAIVEWCRKDPRVTTLTIWCFSTENWKRDPKEVEKLMDLLKTHLTEQRERFMKHGIRVVHSGRTDRFSSSLSSLIKEISEETDQNTEFTLHLAIDYGGKDEVMRAIQRMESTKGITEESIAQHLDHPELPDIDLIIRTGGEHRTSNFFLWQSAYAEWFFSPKLFPDFTEENVNEALEDFVSRSRRKGA